MSSRLAPDGAMCLLHEVLVTAEVEDEDSTLVATIFRHDGALAA